MHETLVRQYGYYYIYAPLAFIPPLTIGLLFYKAITLFKIFLYLLYQVRLYKHNLILIQRSYKKQRLPICENTVGS